MEEEEDITLYTQIIKRKEGEEKFTFYVLIIHRKEKHTGERARD